MRLYRGFSLVELMVTVAVLGVLLAIAAPGFSDMMRNNRSQAAANELVSALNTARTEAVKRGSRVSLCPSSDGATCSGTSWQTGWIVFVDTAASDTAASPALGATLSRRTGMSGGATATGTASFIRFSGLGFAPKNSTITVQVTGCTGPNARTISFSASGRISVQKVNCT
ncbi:GspH/FimT family pseudopilin [Pseudomonas sp. 8AS]|uniref:GspH/FimT family pseudopilin n=1 Tax=Pseudomonas sp. 8AS TaxID=2653163 RepID=UPI0021154301|nr:GspH/FimT family pseudopilin [Pseudomonas sp. 8AS]